MRVLHVYRTYYPDPPGGLQEAIRQIALATTRKGIENRIFALSINPARSEIVRQEGRVFRSKSWIAPASCDLGGAEEFRMFVGLVKWADVLHYHYPWPFADLLHAVARPKQPAVITYHSDIVRQRRLGQVYRPLMMHTLKSMAAIVATSPMYAQTSPVLSEPILRERVCVIPLGVDESSYPRAGDETVLKRLGLGEAEPFFLFIGVLRYYKGLHVLIKAAEPVRAHVVIAGSGPEESKLRIQAQAEGAGNILFAGQISVAEKVALLRRCRAVVLPSHLRSEAYGMVLVEAAMFAKPMISCEIGTGTSYVNKDGETGFVVAPGSPPALASAMTRLLSDQALANRLGQKARQRYQQLLSGNALGTAYVDLYRRLARSFIGGLNTA